MFFQRKPSLDRFLSSPVFTMRLTLDEDRFVGDVSVPSKADSLCAFCLLQTTKVKLQLFVVEVDGCDGRVLGLELLVGIENYDAAVSTRVATESMDSPYLAQAGGGGQPT